MKNPLLKIIATSFIAVVASNAVLAVASSNSTFLLEKQLQLNDDQEIINDFIEHILKKSIDGKSLTNNQTEQDAVEFIQTLFAKPFNKDLILSLSDPSKAEEKLSIGPNKLVLNIYLRQAKSTNVDVEIKDVQDFDSDQQMALRIKKQFADGVDAAALSGASSYQDAAKYLDIIAKATSAKAIVFLKNPDESSKTLNHGENCITVKININQVTIEVNAKLEHVSYHVPKVLKWLLGIAGTIVGTATFAVVVHLLRTGYQMMVKGFDGSIFDTKNNQGEVVDWVNKTYLINKDNYVELYNTDSTLVAGTSKIAVKIKELSWIPFFHIDIKINNVLDANEPKNNLTNYLTNVMSWFDYFSYTWVGLETDQQIISYYYDNITSVLNYTYNNPFIHYLKPLPNVHYGIISPLDTFKVERWTENHIHYFKTSFAFTYKGIKSDYYSETNSSLIA